LQVGFDGLRHPAILPQPMPAAKNGSDFSIGSGDHYPRPSGEVPADYTNGPTIAALPLLPANADLT
jgi:hypothetical protein